MPTPMPTPTPTPTFTFTRYPQFVIAVMEFLQLTIVLDFMILSPLGAVLRRVLGRAASRVGLVLARVAVVAGTGGGRGPWVGCWGVRSVV